ncbi:MAG: helix-hairpin-helix domain-containing protein [Candidatus Helarchaeota archaeon]|nr:helix-hairpin-helix domain-containing protein [Candidatus Helarchaeota archaeon]
MSFNYIFKNGIQPQIDIIQSIAKSLVRPVRKNTVGQVFSLLNVLGAISKKKVITQSNESFKPKAIPTLQESLPIESIKGIGKKIGTKLRFCGITTTADLKVINPKAYNIPGVSQKRLEKWKNNL